MRHTFILSLAIGFSSTIGFAQPAQLVKDMRANPPAGANNSSPSNFATIGGVSYFTAREISSGRELWKTDATTGGTLLVKDIRPSEVSSNPAFLTKVGGTLFFSANDGSSGIELWKSDGTPEGTDIVKDIRQTFTPDSRPQSLVEVSGILYFSADDGLSGRELWKSDGTAAGTVRVKDIVPGTTGSRPVDLTNVNGTLFFRLSDSNQARGDLWKSDGTEEGTVPVRSFLSTLPVSLPISAGGRLFFHACDSVIGCGMWSSDGTGPGTAFLKSYAPYSIVEFQGAAFFSADDPAYGPELWRSDGTGAGTVLVKDLLPGPTGSFPSSFQEANGSLFFFAQNVSDSALWRTDGTPNGTKPIMTFPYGTSPADTSSAGDILYFSRAQELWRSDGTEAGTYAVKLICELLCGETSLTTVNGLLVFQGLDAAHGAELWRSDGTSEGTGLVKDIEREPRSSRPTGLFGANGVVYFTADDGVNGPQRWWRSDGTSFGTSFLNGLISGVPMQMIEFSAGVLFSASDASSGLELWKTDGTEAGTTLVRDISPGTSPSNPESLVRLGNLVLFAATDDVHGLALWKTDGTTAGTEFVKDVLTDTGGSIEQFKTVDGAVFFVVADGPYNGSVDCSLWKSDGTSAGTILVKQLNSPCNNNGPGYLTAVGNLLFFSAYDSAAGMELWKSDGTNEGTLRVKDIFPGAYDSRPLNLTGVGETLFFSASTGEGHELWRSDGTEEGTRLVLDISVPPLMHGSFPTLLTNVNGTLFFTADDGLHGRELWRSDGTKQGTFLVRDIRSGPSGSSPQGLTDLGGTLLFAASDHSHGMEPWKSDGTVAGTVLIQDIQAGPASSRPGYDRELAWAVGGPQVLFSANDGSSGYELWSLPISSVAPQSSFYTVTPCRIVDTRGTDGPLGGPALAGNGDRVFPVSGNCQIPPSAKAISANMTVVLPSDAGYLTVRAAGSPLPLASFINYRPGQVRANNAILPIGAAGGVAVFCGQPSGTVHFVLDVNGYFQ